jgi:hypothetical protein
MVQHAAGCKAVAETPDQHIAALVFLRPERRYSPLRPVHVVDGDKGRLPAHRQPDVARLQIGVHLMAQGFDRGPLRVVVGLGYTRVLVDARNRHRKLEFSANVGSLRLFFGLHYRFVILGEETGNRSRGDRVGRARQRNVPFARE